MQQTSERDTDRALTMSEFRTAAFCEVLRRLPRPIKMFDDGAACPWCGTIHETVTIGNNLCGECRRGFLFGYPPWWEDDRACSWVRLRNDEEDLAIDNPNLVPPFKPNATLKRIYKFWDNRDATDKREPINTEMLH